MVKLERAKKSQTRLSKVWQYFTDTKFTSAKYKAELAFYSNTITMHEHLKCKHPAAMFSDLDGKVFANISKPTGYHVSSVFALAGQQTCLNTSSLTDDACKANALLVMLANVFSVMW